MTKRVKKAKIVTKESFDALINRGDHIAMHAIGRALVHLFNRQTDIEQETNDTKENNAQGFTGADAYSGSLTAKYYLKHRKLLDWQIERWLRKNPKGYSRLSKYWSQINEAAIEKQNKKVSKAMVEKPTKPAKLVRSEIAADEAEQFEFDWVRNDLLREQLAMSLTERLSNGTPSEVLRSEGYSQALIDIAWKNVYALKEADEERKVTKR